MGFMGSEAGGLVRVFEVFITHPTTWLCLLMVKAGKGWCSGCVLGLLSLLQNNSFVHACVCMPPRPWSVPSVCPPPPAAARRRPQICHVKTPR